MLAQQKQHGVSASYLLGPGKCVTSSSNTITGEKVILINTVRESMLHVRF